MATLLLIFHVLVCVFLVLVVLVQSSKGSQMGAAFGGSSQTVFGARGGQTFLAKMTTIGAVVFMLTSLLLAIVEAKKTSIIVGPKPAAQQAPGTNTNIPFGAAGVKPEDAAKPEATEAPAQKPADTQPTKDKK
ncbi:preprotein translocase subunit SecG [Candidatus Magnetominusculus xianensis]|uniref:Protein-export membrane protein SecG n=1 Tax=Candidatus Magnetominusculus xianensis TaxID=1748249 RepID=A0ABR5SNK0_9BACT|nr:preprotein translocase subunit SecG [Candidatus Magnetominusculus xianensis]KWT95074.1 preprotein translocase subunit SecG [Candidatus Magnetominusculus xianensis]MBF0402723.1 preprotein translocase subunit SecG [Nitrospirota bacterium]